MKLTDEAEISWAAGLWEGEGYLYYNEKSDKWQLGIEMADKDVIDHVAEVFSLNVNVAKRNNKPEHWKETYNARKGAKDKIFSIVCDMYPYLGARRREKCDQFLQWYAAKEGMKYD